MNLTPEQIANNLCNAVPEVGEIVKTEAADAGIDRRKLTSPENGKKGGNKHIRPELLAEDFLRQRHTRDGFLTLRRYCGAWYEWRDGFWRCRAEGDVRAAVSGYLQNVGIGSMTRLSRYTIDDVLAMLDADNLCALDSLKFRIPCFLPGGESAAGWMPTKKHAVNVEAVAAAIASGDPIPPDALRAPSPELFTTYGLDYDFDPTAQCPKFQKYLGEVQPDTENRECLQMWAGLSLVPDCRYNVALFLYGEGGTGKSVFAEVLTHLVGADNCCSVPLANLADRFGKAPLTEKLLNIVGDLPTMPENGKTNSVEGFFKQITAGEEIPVERKGVDAYKAPATARMVFATNSMPYIADRCKAIWDRLRIVPFNQRFRGTERQNPNLAAEICREELPGVLNWALVGLAKLRKSNQFPECTEGAALKNEHRLSCDHEREYLTEHVEAAPGIWISSDKLYKAYHAWMFDNGYRPTGTATFKKSVKRIFPKSYEKKQRTDGKQTNCIFNIRWISGL